MGETSHRGRDYEIASSIKDATAVWTYVRTWILKAYHLYVRLAPEVEAIASGVCPRQNEGDGGSARGTYADLQFAGNAESRP